VMLDTTRFDGSLLLGFELRRKGAEKETCSNDDITAYSFYIAPNWDLWAGHVDLTAQLGDVPRENPVVRIPFDAQAEWASLGKEGEVDPGSLRVVSQVPGEEKPRFTYTQYVNGAPEERELVWTMVGAFEPEQEVECRVYLDSLENADRHQAHRRHGWDGEATRYRGRDYGVDFSEGYIRGVRFYRTSPWVHLLSHLGASSQDTGWVDEAGEVESFEVLQDGPVFTQVRVKKNLQGGHSYDKLYTFYPEHFEVTTLSEERFGIMSRAYYVAECQYEDDKGNRAWIDGEGDAEDVSGSNPDPKWYATWSPKTDKEGEPIDAYGWALNCVAVTPHSNVTYWDGGAWAGLGFNASSTEPATVAYVLHRGADDGPSGPDVAALDYERVRSPVTVTRD